MMQPGQNCFILDQLIYSITLWSFSLSVPDDNATMVMIMMIMIICFWSSGVPSPWFITFTGIVILVSEKPFYRSLEYSYQALLLVCFHFFHSWFSMVHVVCLSNKSYCTFLKSHYSELMLSIAPIHRNYPYCMCDWIKDVHSSFYKLGWMTL